jgi:regulatory protein
LIDEKLIDDQNYADSYVRTMMLTSDKGPGVIRRNLKGKKISDQIIEDSVAQFTDDQLKENASKLAEKQFKHYHNQPFKMRIQKVRQSLMVKGFSTDLINSVFDDLSFEANEHNEIENLAKEAKKIWEKNKKFTNYERKMRTKKTLLNKGFTVDKINEFMEKF